MPSRIYLPKALPVEGGRGKALALHSRPTKDTLSPPIELMCMKDKERPFAFLSLENAVLEKERGQEGMPAKPGFGAGARHRWPS